MSASLQTACRCSGSPAPGTKESIAQVTYPPTWAAVATLYPSAVTIMTRHAQPLGTFLEREVCMLNSPSFVQSFIQSFFHGYTNVIHSLLGASIDALVIVSVLLGRMGYVTAPNLHIGVGKRGTSDSQGHGTRNIKESGDTQTTARHQVFSSVFRASIPMASARSRLREVITRGPKWVYLILRVVGTDVMDAFFSGIAPRKHGQPLEPLATQTSRKKINARFEMWLNTYCTPVVPPNHRAMDENKDRTTLVVAEAMVNNSDVVAVSIWIEDELHMLVRSPFCRIYLYNGDEDGP
ncbi:hypothetical protein M441DRAFT_44293 [Trichoderma asperellum CBS 433.97]|uniref:Uncharacterized protein n=1 Tax=Trichoderma asperellum (strain ATCC 204424 / CBS 433.97 / NBRC 101777) TaxID=1042311 RepID=A0A2T3ZHD0_TRIA4|nr:hypothetical protein M441DRAFT_44293 [Trichoderma asperellum CBS 433.97]PTB44206.1 hypothetical protein M441DRAFT_44293 [Trichoderma asperellum CBS 433.97]